jgi:hypothetical protein
VFCNLAKGSHFCCFIHRPVFEDRKVVNLASKVPRFLTWVVLQFSHMGLFIHCFSFLI